MRYLVVILILIPVFASAQVYVTQSGNTLYVEDITQKPYEPTPINIYSNEDIERDTERIQQEVEESYERIRESSED